MKLKLFVMMDLIKIQLLQLVKNYMEVEKLMKLDKVKDAIIKTSG